jgi:hypothetical protein
MLPTMTQLAPKDNAFVICPTFLTPPSAITGISNYLANKEV